MNISEFERTKPVETMRAIDNLIRFIKDTGNQSVTVLFDYGEFEKEVILKLNDIKEKLKRGD
jgi:hypothetical protein